MYESSHRWGRLQKCVGIQLQRCHDAAPRMHVFIIINSRILGARRILSSFAVFVSKKHNAVHEILQDVRQRGGDQLRFNYSDTPQTGSKVHAEIVRMFIIVVVPSDDRDESLQEPRQMFSKLDPLLLHVPAHERVQPEARAVARGLHDDDEGREQRFMSQM